MTRIVTARHRYKIPTMIMRLAVATLALSAELVLAQEAVPGDRVYVLHSEA